MTKTLRVELTEADMKHSPHRAVAGAIIRSLRRHARVELDPIDTVVRLEPEDGVAVRWQFPTPDSVNRHLYYEDGGRCVPYGFTVPVPATVAPLLPAPEASSGV